MVSILSSFTVCQCRHLAFDTIALQHMGSSRDTVRIPPDDRIRVFLGRVVFRSFRADYDIVWLQRDLRKGSEQSRIIYTYPTMSLYDDSVKSEAARKNLRRKAPLSAGIIIQKVGNGRVPPGRALSAMLSRQAYIRTFEKSIPF